MLLSLAALLDIANGRTTRNDLYMGREWEHHATFYTVSDHKVDFANWVSARDTGELLAGLSAFADVLRQELGWMGIQFAQPEPVA